MGAFANGGKPIEPWSLYLNFNHKHKSFKLESVHFSPDGEFPTQVLIKQIESIDPGWREVGGSDPVFMDAATKKNIRLNVKFDIYDEYERLKNNEPREITFFSILNEIFGKV
ncbi:MAG: hypothetical protein HQL78_05585 [Magnetococcales bacterium]|nr:hypothetical protein [Magnetococcales bacterium]